jgi:hypothetical protein
MGASELSSPALRRLDDLAGEPGAAVQSLERRLAAIRRHRRTAALRTWLGWVLTAVVTAWVLLVILVALGASR